jgi:hypothetical protein
MLPDNFYARWRARRASSHWLHENHEPFPPEHLLQAIWQQQRLLRDRLITLDGRQARILHPGFKNHEPGPDFHGAVIQLAGDAPCTGDVEVDLRPGGWTAHGHDRNPAFRGVILQVIWEGDRPVAKDIPVIALREKLDAPLAELASTLGHDSLHTLPDDLRGQCSGPLRELPRESLLRLLREAAAIRLHAKAAQIQSRARQAGWEQALWEGMFRALGYKQNVWPMQNLAETRSRWLPPPRTAPMECQARLLGVGGLLPAELTRKQAGPDGYLRRVWDQWWRERQQFDDCALPRELWRFNVRPANHPQRRLALAAHWLAAGDLPQRLEKWFTAALPDNELVDSLLAVLQVKDDFWSWHWTTRSERLLKSQPMLGAPRVTDLAVNVILPWLWVRAIEGKNEKLQATAQHRYDHWPAAEDNSLLKLARQRLLGGAKVGTLPGAAAQQGLLQILRDFCDHSNALCENCQFPELVRDFV